MLYGLMITLILVIAILLVIAVLLQAGRGGGLAGIAAGGQAQQILGARQAPDTLEKATWVLGTAFILLCVLTTVLTGVNENSRSVLQEQRGAPVQQAPAPVLPAPTQPAPAAPQPAQ